MLLRMYRLMPRLIFQKNLQKTYGLNTWAIITGASDGIGKALCYELAKKGFNIVLVARDVLKMENICMNLQSEYQVETKIVKADFTEGDQINFYENLMNQLQGLDVSILVNNVGISQTYQHFDMQDEQVIMDHMTVNAQSTLFMTHLFIQQALQRNTKSAVINISSILAVYPVPLFAIYSGTKAFQNYLSLSLGLDYKDKIDFLSIKPSGVSTNMINNIEGRYIISPEQCAQAAIIALSRGETESFGHKQHKIFVDQYKYLSQLYCHEKQITMGYNLAQMAKKRSQK